MNKCILKNCNNKVKDNRNKCCSYECAKQLHFLNKIIINIKCLNCQKSCELRDKKQIFCSRSCSAIYHNKIRYPNSTPMKFLKKQCLNCNNLTTYNYGKYCSRSCCLQFKRDIGIKKWIEGDDDGSTPSFSLKKHFRDYLIKEANNKCPRCSWGEINPKVGRAILTIDHIDGNWLNNNFENVRVLCYNCHTLTPTFGSLNKNGKSQSRPGGNRYKHLNVIDNNAL